MSKRYDLIDLLSQIPETNTALSDTQGVQLSYRCMLREVDKTRDFLKRNNISGFATLMDNSPAHVIALIAAASTTAWVIPIPPFFTNQQRNNALMNSGCTALLSDTKNSSLPLLGELSVAGHTLYFYRTGIDSNDGVIENTTLITFTSGSTAAPKGLCLSSENILSTSQAVASKLTPLSIKKHLCILPLSVLLEHTAGVFAALISGAECIVPSLQKTGIHKGSNTKPNSLSQLLRTTEANSCILVPELLKVLVTAEENESTPLKKISFVAVGGSKTSPEILRRAQDLGLPVYEGYGLSEASSVITLNTPFHNETGSVGLELIGNSISISEDGEVLLNAPSFLGYCGDLKKPEQPFPTGDIGKIDGNGYLHISGRKKNILITSMGRNVCPEWIESSLSSSRHIYQAYVYGDGQTSLSALIVSEHPAAIIQQAINRINSTLPDYARIDDWRRVPEFTALDGTLTGNGKLRRNAVSLLHLHASPLAHHS